MKEFICTFKYFKTSQYDLQNFVTEIDSQQTSVMSLLRMRDL